MPRQSKPSLGKLDELARRIDDRLPKMAKPIADSLGPPSGTDRYTQRERDALWDTRDMAVNRDALFAALQQGLPAEDVERFALFRMAPDLAKLVTATPLDPERAAMIAQLAERPGQYVLTVGHSSDPAEQVKFVAEEQKRAARRAGAVEMAAEPEMGGY